MLEHMRVMFFPRQATSFVVFTGSDGVLYMLCGEDGDAYIMAYSHMPVNEYVKKFAAEPAFAKSISNVKSAGASSDRPPSIFPESAQTRVGHTVKTKRKASIFNAVEFKQ